FYIVDSMPAEQLKERLAASAAELAPPDAYVAIGSDHAYFPKGRFEVEGMLAMIRSFYRNAREEGFPGARLTGEMSWIARDVPGNEHVMEYEARLTPLFRGHPYVALCQYDMRLFSGTFIMDALSVHPYTIVRGQIVENPFFIAPDEFLSKHAA